MTRGRRRGLRGLLVSEAVSLTGTRVSMVAIPLLVLQATGSPTRTGLVALVEMVPLILLKVLGGPVTDRLGGARVAIACDLASVPVVAAVPLLHRSGLLPFGVFLLLVGVAGGLRGPGDGAKQALVPLLVAEAEVPMERATGLAGTVERTASMLGAALAGALVAALGAADALYVDAGSFALSAAVLASTVGWRRPDEAAAPVGVEATAGEPLPSYARQLREGVAFLRHDRVLLGIVSMVALTNLLDAGWTTVLVPVWAVTTGGGAAAVGTLFAVFSGASALGAVTAAVWAARLPRYAVYLTCFLVAGLPRFAVMTGASPWWLVLAVAVVAGYASGFLNPVLGAVIFERIPAHLVARVSSLNTALCWSLMPFGGLLAGVLVSGAGLGTAMLAVGLAYAAVTLLPAVDPRWREIDRRPVPSDLAGPSGPPGEAVSEVTAASR